MANERKRLKMIDVARAAGVSATTVSRVLAGVEGASSEKTAIAIRQAASELGYVVNGVASGLRSQQTRTVGLVLADVGNPFFGQVASGVENTLSDAGYSVILVNTNNSIEQEKQLVRVLIEKRVDALVVATSAKSGDHIREAVDGGMQVVLVDSELPDIRGDSVVIDNAAAAQTAVQHLLDLGHKHICIVTGRLEASFDSDRLEGYRRALRRVGIEPNPLYCVPGESSFEGGRRAVTQALSLSKRPTAIFVTNNVMTVGALVAIAECGLSLPRDVSVVGFDDMDWYRIANPPITAIRQPAYEMGRIAAEKLLQNLRRKRQQRPQRFCLEAKLIIRQSTAPPVVEQKIEAGELP
jgi:LacI family transcriptional regulator